MEKKIDGWICEDREQDYLLPGDRLLSVAKQPGDLVDLLDQKGPFRQIVIISKTELDRLKQIEAWAKEAAHQMRRCIADGNRWDIDCAGLLAELDALLKQGENDKQD